MAAKSKKKEERYVMICPKCKSTEVYMDKTNPLQPAMGLPSMYICDKCGHSGYAFPEVSVSEIDGPEEEMKDEGEIDNDLDKTQKVDTSYGNFEVRVIWKIIAPIILVLGIFSLFNEPIYGVIYITIGIILGYITYFKKRKLKED